MHNSVRWALRCALAVIVYSTSSAPAQTEQARPATPTANSNSTSESEVPQVPGLSSALHGVNAGVTISGVHDSATGWATITTPTIGYSFKRIFSGDITIPIYMYRLAQSRATNPKPSALLVNQRGEPGDVIFAVHADFSSKWLDYEATVAGTAPTGDELYGLTSGRATFDFSNQFEHSFRLLSPSIEMGVGDSTTLVNRLVTKNYTSLGPIAHFTGGVSVPILWGTSFSADAYEQLPIGDQKIYTSTTRRNVTTTVVTGHNVSEDNGLTGSIDLPIDGHLTLSSYYNHSLRLHDDTVSIGITYVIRALPPVEPPIPTDDLFR